MSLKHPTVARLQAELKVRTEMYPRDRARPAEFCRRGYSSAYDTGFELAWRGRPIGSPYTQSHLRRAQQAGWFAGLAAAEREIARVLKGG